MGYGFDLGLEKERLRCGGLDLVREKGVEVGGGFNLGLKREGLRSAVSSALSLFPAMSSDLWWRWQIGPCGERSTMSSNPLFI